MAGEPTPARYRKLPGGGISREAGMLLWRTYATLWLGGDHLLSVTSTGFGERYRRFYFRDIQAVIVRRTIEAVLLRLLHVLVALLLAGAAWLFYISDMAPGTAIMLVLMGLTLILLVIDVARGPTCVVHIRTAVQMERLAALTRVAKAEKALAVVRPHIAAAQQELAPLPAEFADQVPATTLAVPPRLTSYAARQRPAVFRPLAHWILFLALAADVVSTSIRLLAFHAAWIAVEIALTPVVAIAVVMALVLQHAARQRGPLVFATWGVAAYLAVAMVAGQVLSVLAVTEAQSVAETASVWATSVGIARRAAEGEQPFLAVQAGACFVSAALAVLGLLALLRRRLAPPAPTVTAVAAAGPVLAVPPATIAAPMVPAVPATPTAADAEAVPARTTDPPPGPKA